MSLGVIAASYVAGGAVLTLVGTRLTYTASSLSSNVLFPAGIAAGDLLLLQIGTNSTFGDNIPAGWTVANSNRTGGWFHGATAWKIATATDVTNGSVTFTFGQVGAHLSTITAVRGATSASVLYQVATPNPGDASEAVSVAAGSGLLVYASFCRNWSTVAAVNRGTQRQAQTGQIISGVLKTEDAGAAVTTTFSASGTLEGTYYSAVRLT